MATCPSCNTPTGAPDWEARQTHVWGNQHGEMVRIFCKACGYWTDNRMDCQGKVVRWRFVGQHKPENAGNEWHNVQG